MVYVYVHACVFLFLFHSMNFILFNFLGRRVPRANFSAGLFIYEFCSSPSGPIVWVQEYKYRLEPELIRTREGKANQLTH